VDRPACVDAPALPLQLLLRRHPDWADAPVAVVAEDKSTASILWVNEAARRRRVLSGMRYAAGLALAAGLRADVVARQEIDEAVASILERLLKFTPRVEPSTESPGVFLLDASGLSRTWPSLDDWARAIRRDLAGAGLRTAVVVGFTRFGVQALAQATRRFLVFDDAAAEVAAVRRVPLSRLPIDPRLRDCLAKLGVHSVADFLALPQRELATRFGAEAERLHRLARGDVRESMRPEVPREPLRRAVQSERPETDGQRLVFLVKRLVDALVRDVAALGEAIVEVAIELDLDGGGRRAETVRPATPTLEAAQILDLVRLKFESMERETPLARGVVEMALVARTRRVAAAQAGLFAERPRRDLAAADRAFARLAAEFGADAVVTATLVDSHLPEESFAWTPLVHARRPSPRVAPEPTLIRRLFAKPIPLPTAPRDGPDGWLLLGVEAGPVIRLGDPDLLETRWWKDEPVACEQYLVETLCRLSWVRRVLAGETWLVLSETQ
jgi:protein ImuB